MRNVSASVLREGEDRPRAFSSVPRKLRIAFAPSFPFSSLTDPPAMTSSSFGAGLPVGWKSLSLSDEEPLYQ